MQRREVTLSELCVYKSTFQPNLLLAPFALFSAAGRETTQRRQKKKLISGNRFLLKRIYLNRGYLQTAI
jgi:hypothetical protein